MLVHDVTDGVANDLEHLRLATEETTRSPYWQHEEIEADRLSEGTEDGQRLEQRQVVAQRRAVGRFVLEGLDPNREEALHQFASQRPFRLGSTTTCSPARTASPRPPIRTVR